MMNPEDQVFLHEVQCELVWIPRRGVGFYPAAGDVYDQAYFNKYIQYSRTPLGQALTHDRVNLVNRYTMDQDHVDVGIGCGAFIEMRELQIPTYGYDINPAGVEWLTQRNLWVDPRQSIVASVSFWDVLEHIPDPAEILDNVTHRVFMSTPIFADAEHVLRSKHFRPDEHCWYWTRDGLLWWMGKHGFDCVEHSTPESLLGREDIHTFVFRRREPAMVRVG